MSGDLWRASRRRLMRCDPVMRDILKKVGPCPMQKRRDHFSTLCKSIVSQQLSTKVADVIWKRLLDHAGGRVRADNILNSKQPALRALGLSGQKISYLKDLSERVGSGRLILRFPATLADETIIERLTEVRGIGRWTAEMFLMFSLCRPDVFSAGDLGLRNALVCHYDLKNREDLSTAAAIAARWAPDRTLASWALWRSLEV